MSIEKEFRPTPRRISEARRKGQMLKSPSLTQLAALLGGVIGLLGWGCFTWVRFEILIKYPLLYGIGDPVAPLILGGQSVVRGVLTTLCLAALCGIGAELIQVGGHFGLEVLKPKWDRLNLASGVSKIGAGLKSLGQIIIRLVVLSALSGWFFYWLIGVTQQALYADLQGVTHLLWCVSGAGLGMVLIGFGAQAVLEYWFRRNRYFKDLSMSHQEIREEYRESEGDPVIRSVRRALHQSLAQTELVARVRRAKVIVVERS